MRLITRKMDRPVKIWKMLKGYLFAVTYMCFGLTVLNLLYHHRMPSVLVLMAGAAAGISIEFTANRTVPKKK